MPRLSIDIETYSSVDLKKSGMYKYAQSPDFEILLLAYSFDDGPVTVLDLTGQASVLPPELLSALLDPTCTKQAYNAAFEWYCLSRYLNLPDAVSWLSQWRCTMLHGLYCGYPAGLDAVGRALGLPTEQQKLVVGKALIKYFCSPCKPTQTNGQRTRNLPQHDPDRWSLFKGYNRQDVATEMEVERRMSAFPVPDAVQAQWVTDQIINARGVAVDLELLEGALACGKTVRDGLMQEATALSGLNNPNSLRQLRGWLEKETGDPIGDLRKDTVKTLLGGELESEHARRMLEIRQSLGKTSTKKYDAMENAVCADGRVRGMLRFYGANRTGRWAGRIVQVQNLPQTHLSPLPLARELVKSRALDALCVVYGGIPDTLSQLIRTALVASPGQLLADADFSAIEARVIAWLAGEKWVLEVFRTHGKIYEACAAQMFGVPIETIAKGQENYLLRQKGKVATLALGYQGGVDALTRMDSAHTLKEEEKPEIVQRWRDSNKRIRDLWYSVENAALSAVRTGTPSAVGCLWFAREYDPANGQDFLTITLPSKRKLFYVNPRIGKNRWDRDSIRYQGMNQVSRKWESTETYGGKLVENITQAVARDCLSDAITRLEAAGYPVVFHVHDEVVIDCAREKADLGAICEIMGQSVSWAPGLPLRADGWTDVFYKKE